MDDLVIVAALRTAVGKFGGTIAKIPAADLGAKVMAALLQKTGVKPGLASEVTMGQVLTAGMGQNPARQASIRIGLPHPGDAAARNDQARCEKGLGLAVHRRRHGCRSCRRALEHIPFTTEPQRAPGKAETAMNANGGNYTTASVVN